MKVKDIINDYLEDKTVFDETVRLLTGVLNPDSAVDILVLLNQLSRIEQGDLEIEVFRNVHGLWGET